MLNMGLVVLADAGIGGGDMDLPPLNSARWMVPTSGPG
jgi:hypothetical protein